MKYKTVHDAETAFLRYVPKPSLAAKPYTLATITKLLEHLGNPHDTLRVIHVAGTSGKTSTSYFIRGLLQEAGQKTGLTVSPHITSIKERVQIDGDVLPDELYLAYASEFLEQVEASRVTPSFFEVMMAFAFWVFEKERVDYAVVETGMGGLLDGSNVTRRPDKIAIITDIGLDHTHILGHTIKEIALQKAGIIHPGNQLFLIDQPAEATTPIVKYARSQQAVVHIVSSRLQSELPTYQQRNWSLAKTVYSYVQDRDGLSPLTNQQYEHAMKQTPPGRLEQLPCGDKLAILDGAHSPQKLQALANALKGMGISQTAAMASFVNAPEYKLVDNMAALRSFASHLIIPEFMVVQDIAKQSPPAEEIKALAQNAGIRSLSVQRDVRQGVDGLLARPEKVVIITGSLYLVSQARAYLEKQR